MTAPAHSHEESGLLATFGSHVLGEYRMNTISNMRESLANVEVVAYSHFLESRGTRLEDALEWNTCCLFNTRCLVVRSFNFFCNQYASVYYIQ